MAITPKAAKRRFIFRSAAIIVGVTVAAVLFTTAAERSRARYDLTATRQHALSPRTKQILDSLDRDYEIAVVADFTTVSPLARGAVDDVLDELAKSTGTVRVTTIDASRPDQEDEFTALLDRLSALYTDDIAGREETLTTATESLNRTVALLEGAAGAIGETALLTDAVSAERPALENLAATIRVRTRDAQTAVTQIETLRSQQLLGSTLAPLDDALAAARAQLTSLAADAETILARFAPAAAASEPTSRATAALEQARDVAATASESLSSLAPSELYAIVRALERDSAVVIVSDHAATAIAFSALFPAAAEDTTEDSRTVTEFRFVGEELLATALAALENPNRPIVVLTHPWPVRLLDDSGAPNPNAGPLAIAGLIDRMRLRGIDALEWPVGDADAPPAMAELDPGGTRPVVWAILGTVAANSDTSLRNAKLATAIEELTLAGENILLSYSPSTLPGAGTSDILTAPLAGLGVTLDTGRPLLRAVRTPQGSTTDPGITFTQSVGEHPIASAINGLTTRLGWVSAIEIEPVPGVTAEALYEVGASPDTWGESQWTDLWSSSQNARRRTAPTPTAGLDDLEGPWTVAATIQRASAKGEGRLQRLVVVGATAWYFDGSILPARRVDGRIAAAFPGNGELFDASVAWLAGQDNLIAPGAVTQDIPRIEPIDPGALTVIRWVLAVGPAVAVLLLGAAVRMIRG